MPRPVQLHVMLSEEEMSSLRSLADSLGTTVSDTVRLLRSLGHLLNQSTHALNAIAKAVRESGVDALDLAEAMGGVSYGLDEVRRDAAEVRRQAAELTGMPVVFGE